jgi:hypothetical protein
MADILPLQFLQKKKKKLPCSRSSQIPFSLDPMSFLGAILLVRKALPRFFLCIFTSLTTRLKKRVFSKRDLLLRWKVFLKSGKIPALLYLGKGPE